MASGRAQLLATALLISAAASAALYGVHEAYDWSEERIAANERARVVARLNSVLDPSLLGRDLSTVLISATDPDLLGTSAPIDVFVLFESGTPVATILAPVAPHGYNAAISVLLGIAPDGTLTGVRAIRHRETQGLGDAIEVAKSDWILQFNGKSLSMPVPALWAISQDDGELDSISGATVTSRAVVAAIKDALLYFEQHRDELYARAAQTAAETNDL